jgi:hypothetical protein
MDPVKVVIFVAAFLTPALPWPETLLIQRINWHV